MIKKIEKKLTLQFENMIKIVIGRYNKNKRDNNYWHGTKTKKNCVRGWS